MSERIGPRLVLPLVLLFALQPTARAADEPAPGFDAFPLRPADTSSPRDTLRSFNRYITEGFQAVETGAHEAEVARAAERARETFDFSQLSERGRIAREIESILLMKEILDRIALPPLEEIPGDQTVANKDLTQWTIPDTRITIARVEEGPRAGEFLFTAETVDRLRQDYERAKLLPYKPGAIVGFYEDYQNRPGRMVPRAWMAALPAWSKTVVLGEAIWQWIGLAIVIAVGILSIRPLLRWGRRWDKRERDAKPHKRLGLPLAVAASIGIVWLAGYAFVEVLRIISDIWFPLSFVVWTLIFVGLAWLAVLLASRIAEVINDARQVKEGSIDGQLVATVLRLLSLVIVVFLVIYSADFFGIPLTPVLAGLGVGGLAIALAIRPTLENVIGGLTLFADKPVRIGDYCRFGSDYGTVEEIGLRSTRLRKLDDTVVSVPNADFSQRELTNLTRRRRWLYRTRLGLCYETSPEQLRYVLAKLREMLLGHPKVSDDLLHVRFDGFGAYSLDVEVFAYIRSREWLTYRGIREDINLRIVDIVKDAGTGFAFPSQTAYLGRDRGLDEERGRAAEARVQEWRAKGQLPFPEMAEELRREAEDRLDYPPEGSPDHKLAAGRSDAHPGTKNERG